MRQIILNAQTGEIIEEETDIELPEVVIEPSAVLDAEFQPQFQALQLAWAAASLEGNNELVTAIQADYVALKAEYQSKREAMANG